MSTLFLFIVVYFVYYILVGGGNREADTTPYFINFRKNKISTLILQSRIEEWV